MKTLSRRMLLRDTFVMAALVSGAASGILTPRTVMAAWPQGAFDGKAVPEVMDALFQAQSAAESDQIRIKAPEIAENGTVVPVTIVAGLKGISSISLIAEGNPRPLAAVYKLSSRTSGAVTTRIKLAKTQKVTAVVLADGKLYRASKEIKVTVGGCGG